MGIMGFGYGMVPMLFQTIGIALLFYFVMKSPFVVAIMSGLVLCGTAPGISFIFAF